MRLPLDHHASRRTTGTDRPLAHPLLPINIAIGQSTWASQRVKANLFYRGLTLLRPVHLEDTLYTRTKVVGLRQNKPQPGRAATGIVALEMTTVNQAGDTVLHFWRCPMIPCRDAEARTGHADDLERIGAAVGGDAARAALTCNVGSQRLQALERAQSARSHSGRAIQHRSARHDHARPRARTQFAQYGDGTHGRQTVRSRRATGLRRSHDFMGYAQLTRALPNSLSLLAWERCDHTAPVVENDRLRTECTVTDIVPLPADRGALLAHRRRGACGPWRTRNRKQSSGLDCFGVERMSVDVQHSESITTRLVRRIVRDGARELPPAALDATRTFVLDSLGVALSGTRVPMVRELATLAAEWGRGDAARVWARASVCRPRPPHF
jgi:acyl dehydratase